MNGPWFRLYTDWYRNRKVRGLRPEDQLLFLDLMCLHREGHLVGSSVEDLVWHLRKPTLEVESGVKRLQEAKLLLEDLEPKGWDERQFESDVSTERVRKHRRNMRRKRRGNVSGNGNGNASGNRSETFRTEQNRTEREPPNPHSGGLSASVEFFSDLLEAMRGKCSESLTVDGLAVLWRNQVAAEFGWANPRDPELVEFVKASADGHVGRIGSAGSWLRAQVGKWAENKTRGGGGVGGGGGVVDLAKLGPPAGAM